MKKAATAPASVDIAKELHDSVCQTLTGVHLQLNVLARKVKKNCPDCGAEMEELEKLIARARDELHAIVKKIPQ